MRRIRHRTARVERPGGELKTNSSPIPVSLSGHITGDPTGTEAAMRFARANGVRPMTETVSLDHAADTLAEQQAGRARFRMVLTIDG